MPASIQIAFTAEPQYGTILCTRQGHGSVVYRLDEARPIAAFLTSRNIAEWNAACEILGWPKEKFL